MSEPEPSIKPSAKSPSAEASTKTTDTKTSTSSDSGGASKPKSEPPMPLCAYGYAPSLSEWVDLAKARGVWRQWMKPTDVQVWFLHSLKRHAKTKPRCEICTVYGRSDKFEDGIYEKLCIALTHNATQKAMDVAANEENTKKLKDLFGTNEDPAWYIVEDWEGLYEEV
ncbi:hypothetical protein BOTBODRAFT_494266 [Botryobasidium botryosum FD-172 SS1]|uniref:Uncharacterized protein n=1 Tax=Botryobasidium botryosum (strain FD-172 SS1) TaxID=930990 RepID=A0A067MET7_BOTB1|nr:hypothetical protein BOTBODRAFT_494266 [Botryobasidium botryosum FD-172 SS1]